MLRGVHHASPISNATFHFLEDKKTHGQHTRLIQAMTVFVRMLQKLLGWQAAPAYNSMIEPWQKAWVDGGVFQEIIFKPAHSEGRIVAEKSRGSTTLLDRRGAFPQAIRSGLWGPYEGAGAPPAYIRIRERLFATPAKPKGP